MAQGGEVQARLYVPQAQFVADAPCACESGKPFADCCGSSAPERAPPAGVAVVRDFLSKKECGNFVRFAERQERQPLLIYDSQSAAAGRPANLDTGARKTMQVAVGKREQVLNDWVRRACLEVLQPACGARIEWFELPYVLRYGPGDYYVRHADGEEYEGATRRWYRSIDRDVSILIYLNDDFEGGGLLFDNFNYLYRPRTGDLVFFPSTHAYTHESRPVVTGRKFALASWGAIAGAPRVDVAPFQRVFL